MIYGLLSKDEGERVVDVIEFPRPRRNCIIDEVRGIDRVPCDSTSKPLATARRPASAAGYSRSSSFSATTARGIAARVGTS